MTTHDFKIAGGDLGNFINFASGDPYYLDFSEGGQKGTISWGEYQVAYQSFDGGFRIWYDPKTDGRIFDQITYTVSQYNHSQAAEHHKQE
jgi:hypothetical protein